MHVVCRELCASSRCHKWSLTPGLPCTPHSKSAAPFRQSRGSFVRSVTSCVQQTKRSSFSRTTDDADPGHWEYSPEWWGTHAGGWGRDSGRVLFSQQSHCGNGEITVTAHPASSTPASSRSEQEWRVLRFNDTRQSVSRVLLSPEWLVPKADAACLAFEYLKTMSSAAAAIIGVTGKLETTLLPIDPQLTAHTKAEGWHTHRQPHLHASPTEHPARGITADGKEASRMLCIGLGGGSLPNFLSHHFPGLHVDAVELDPLVVTAASDYMGFPQHRPNMQLHQCDAADYVLKLAADVHEGRSAPLDMVFVDAFDGNDDVPASLWSSDSLVLDALSRVLHPEHGSLVMNLHGGGMPTSSALLALLASWLPFASQITFSGYHPSTEKGRAVQQITQNLRQKLLGRHGRGCAFTLSVQRQSNVVVVVTRGIDAEAVQNSAIDLHDAANQTGQAAGYLFECGSRACRGLTLI